MTNCANRNGCPYAADCSGPGDCAPAVPVKPKVLADMNLVELRDEQDVAIGDKDAGYAELVGHYITAYYRASRAYAESHE